jgi:UDP:flavonoid glycosyltransferase YjiC (YdhE family)
MKRILITAMGSHGDVLPFISMAAEFRRRGFEVFVYANPFFADSAASCGAVFRPIGTVADYEGLFAQAPDSNPPKAMAAVAGYMARQTPACYRAMYGDVRPGRTLVIGGSLFFAHRLVAESLGVPCATVHLAPAAIRSTIAPARIGPGGAWLREKSPFWLRQLFWWLADRAHTDRYFLAPLNSMRTQLGLAPLPELFSPWLRQVDAEVALFPAWFSGAPADWPAQLQHCDFPFDDPACAAELPDDLRDFLAAGPAPVGFTAGTATANAREFFARSARACEQGGLRGLLLTHFAQQVPDKLPPGVLHVGYAPYARLLPRLAALVHHGGIGTTAQALRAGIPQVVRPTAYDQFDNAQRLVALKVAREILPRRYTENHICNTLAELMHDTTVRAQCHAIAEQMRPAAATNAGIASACEAVLSGCGWPPGTVADPVG